MDRKTKLYVIGGFLGAGKTTSLLSLARLLADCGTKVAIVTNDQGSDLVDTAFLQKSGLPVLEVTGGCFCCNFDEFTTKVNELSSELKPDIVLAEPVGSCTDLIATIFKPLQLDNTRQFTLGPLSVVVDPKRVKKLMMETQASKETAVFFPSEINYLFRKQLEEADIIVINKIDKLLREELCLITAFLKETFPSVQIHAVSAKEGLGIDEWADKICSFNHYSKPSLNIDYETYTAAEEYLGWMNSSLMIRSVEPQDGNKFIENLLEAIKSKLSARNMEIAHLKVYAVSEDDWAKASITSIEDEVDFNRKLSRFVSKANVLINARVNSSPEDLSAIIKDTLENSCASNNVILEYIDTQCFRPGKPRPTHRL